MTFIDLFAGIGGFRLGMEMAGHTCLGHCEWDKYANRSYIAMHQPKESEWYAGDIRTVRASDIPRCDCWCFGFPCQDISVAGKQLGFDGKRSSLFFTVTKLIRDTEQENKPSTLFIENIKNLLSVNGGIDFLKLLIELDEIGYDAEWQVLNSKNFGVPQNRERVFIIGHLRGRGGREVFPIGFSCKDTDVKCLNAKNCDGKQPSQHDRIYSADGVMTSLMAEQAGRFNVAVNCIGNVNPSGNGMNGNIFAADGLSPTLTTNKGEGIKICLDKTLNNPRRIDIANCLTTREDRGLSNRQAEGTMVAIPVLTPERLEKRQNGRRFKTDGEPMFTLTSQDRHGVAIYQKPRGNNNGGLKEDCPTITKNSFEQNNLVVSGIYTNVSERFNAGPLNGISRCLKANKHDAGITDGIRIRKLTPLECFRLQGFPDAYFYKAKWYSKIESEELLVRYPKHKGKREFTHEQRIERMSNSQLYKQAGNSVTVKVIYEIAKRLRGVIG